MPDFGSHSYAPNRPSIYKYSKTCLQNLGYSMSYSKRTTLAYNKYCIPILIDMCSSLIARYSISHELYNLDVRAQYYLNTYLEK